MGPPAGQQFHALGDCFPRLSPIFRLPHPIFLPLLANEIVVAKIPNLSAKNQLVSKSAQFRHLSWSQHSYFCVNCNGERRIRDTLLKSLQFWIVIEQIVIKRDYLHLPIFHTQTRWQCRWISECPSRTVPRPTTAHSTTTD